MSNCSWIAALLVAAALAGCRREPPTAEGAAARPRAVRDSLGRIVRLAPADRVARVVSLASSSTEIVYALGAGPRLVGVDGYSDFPREVAAVPRVGAEVDPSLERIVALKPDVVFTATSANTQAT